LEANLGHIINLIEKTTGRVVRNKAGDGAAGGMGAALMAFLYAKTCSGIELVMRESRFADHLRDADLVITGEGRLDGTSAQGKVVAGIAEQAAKRHIPTVVLAGGIGKDAHNILNKGVAAYFSICNGPMSLEYAQQNALALIADSTEQIIRLFCAGQLDSKCNT